MSIGLNYSEQIKMKKSGIVNLVFNGGGILGQAYCGSLKALEEADIMAQIKNIAGASAGSMMALLCAIGYTSTEVETLLKNTDFADLMDSGMLDIPGIIAGDFTSYFTLLSLPEKTTELFNDCGLCDGVSMLHWLENIMLNKGFDPLITFEQLYKKTGIGLFVTNCDVSLNSYVVRSHLNTPHMQVTLACLASVSIPILYKPVRIDEHVLNDGGTTNNFPIDIFDKLEFPGETLGLLLNTKDQILKPQINKINNIIDYLIQLLATFRATSIVLEFQEQRNIDRTVFIDTLGVNFLNFTLSDKQTHDLIASGKKCTEEYLNLLN